MSDLCHSFAVYLFISIQFETVGEEMTDLFVNVHKGGRIDKTTADETLTGLVSHKPFHPSVPPVKQPYEEFAEKELRRSYINNLRGMTAYERHMHFIENYAKFYRGEDKWLMKQKELLEQLNPAVTDQDVINRGYRFLRTEEDNQVSAEDSGLVRYMKEVSARYYQKLNREYCIIDLSSENARKGQVGMRWRTSEEVMRGKGQWSCGERKCARKDDLLSLEMMFEYEEEQQLKKALVKVRLCPSCQTKLSETRGTSTKKNETKHGLATIEDTKERKTSEQGEKRKRSREKQKEKEKGRKEEKKEKKREKRKKKEEAKRVDVNKEEMDQMLDELFQ